MSKFAELTFASSDARRAAAKKVGKYLPPDMAAVTVAVSRGNRDGDVYVPEPDTRTAYRSTITVLPRLRVATAMVEPNVINLARNLSTALPCRTRTGADGVFVTEWASPAEHAAAYATVYKDYLNTHEVVGDIGRGFSTDSWHSPMLLVPVRHTYADGSKSVSALMAADGTARVWGSRLALATDLAAWHTVCDWSDPGTRWDLSMATARKVVAAARVNSRATGIITDGKDPGRAGAKYALSDGSVEDWADILIPDPEFSFHDLGLYLYHVHNSPAQVQVDPQSPFTEGSQDWVKSIDVFTGRDPFDLMGLSAARTEDRDEVAETAEAMHEDLLRVSSSKEVTARRITLAAVAWRQQGAAGTVGLSDTEPWFGLRQWLHTVTTQTRHLHHRANQTLLGLARDLPALRPFPDCDLYGIGRDLDNNALYPPLDDPTSDWFALTAMRALTYAALHGHLIGAEMDRGPAYRAAEQAMNEAYDAAYDEAEREGLDPDKATEDLPDLTDTPEVAAEMAERTLFVAWPDNILDRLVTTPEGHRVVLAYAAHAVAGTIPPNLFGYRATTAGQRVDLLDPTTVASAATSVAFSGR